jgi:redox-sensitive bicupin YhaK (pirin superfamily)
MARGSIASSRKSIGGLYYKHRNTIPHLAGPPRSRQDKESRASFRRFADGPRNFLTLRSWNKLRRPHFAYFYVFTGKIAIGGESFREGEAGLITSSARISIDADKESIVVAFVLNPNAKLVRLGTVGR